jgi:hypothetical protein
MSKQKEIPALPPGQEWLSDFASQHRISQSEAYGLWQRGNISGTKVGEGRKARIAISAAGRHDAYIQFKILPNFTTCEQCPHAAVELPIIPEKKAAVAGEDWEDQEYEEYLPAAQFERGGDYAGEFDYLKESKEEEVYKPTAADQALATSMRVTELGGAILQAHVDGEMSLQTYNKLYDIYEKAHIAAATLQHRLESE